MNKQKIVGTEYQVFDKSGIVDEFIWTRHEARQIAKKLGGRKAGIRIIQQRLVNKEIR